MPDEPTEATPAEVAAPGSGVTADASPTPDEATAVMGSGAASDVADPEDQDTVAIPPDSRLSAQDELSAPIPAAAGAAFTRRRLLIGLAAVTGTALVTGAVAVHSARSGPDKAPVQSSPTRPAVTRPRTPESTTVAAPPVPVQSRPIFTLAEYRRATGATAFPADAIALTIDDGPHPVWTPRILRLLDRHQVPALFCMIGNQVLGHEDVARTVTRAGHQLANHTWSHPTKLSGKPAPLVQKEIRKAQAKIKKTTGYAPTLFRSPGGDWSAPLLHAVAHAGLLPLDWSIDPRDWSRPGTSRIEHRLLAAHPGQILLCHDGGGDRSQTYHALSVIIPALKARGLEFVALHG